MDFNSIQWIFTGIPFVFQLIFNSISNDFYWSLNLFELILKGILIILQLNVNGIQFDFYSFLHEFQFDFNWFATEF